ncbi:hypothetical protein HBI81_260190 [Parastagonospora nodorum]|nr:hypothetical protein HBI18_251930 [Parastagonospora nodorum]KAH6510372.1 hypothetical protein HBI81_260190 [Parastagonospora nodorum]
MASNVVSTVLDGFLPYEQYRTLGQVPLTMGPFALDQAGDPIVHMGEVRCRILLAPGALCGDNDLVGGEEQLGNAPPPPPSSDSDSDDEEPEEDQVAGYGFPPLPAPGFDAEGVEPPSSEVSSSSPEPSSESSYDSESD